MASVFPGGNYRSEPFILTDTNTTVVYTCPAGMTASFIIQLWASDSASNARTLDIYWTDSSAAVTYTLAIAKAIAANAQLDIEFKPLVLEPGDTLKLKASAATIHGFVSVQEIGGQ